MCNNQGYGLALVEPAFSTEKTSRIRFTIADYKYGLSVDICDQRIAGHLAYEPNSKDCINIVALTPPGFFLVNRAGEGIGDILSKNKGFYLNPNETTTIEFNPITREVTLLQGKSRLYGRIPILNLNEPGSSYHFCVLLSNRRVISIL